MEQQKNAVEISTNVSQEFIASKVQEVVKSAIVGALGDPEELVRQAIGDVLNARVDKESGKVSDKGDWYTMPFIDWLVMDTVKTTVKECVQEAIRENRDEFKAAVLRQLRSKKNQNKVAEAFCETILSSAESGWKMPISISLEFKKND